MPTSLKTSCITSDIHTTYQQYNAGKTSH